MTQTTLREYLRTTEDAISSGRIEEAMASCQNILTYFPEALEAQRLLGEVYLAQGQMEEAQQTFEWILTNDPENVIVYCDRALISERTSDIDTALDCYQQAYELSRGSSDIRQQFNQLSARVGQQEFMFSRAGLARLYMRGDLLTQAIQEWEAVLSISPDRLDARLGLMETYWREGTYEKAEQVAMQLLEEVPTCLKALLFLAHIASISNMPRARDFLLRAEALDPELGMAQELFADLAASQPGDPFLALLTKEPILLDNGRPITSQSANAPAVQKVQSAPAPLDNTYGNWDTLDNWDQPLQSSTPTNQSAPATQSRLDQNGSGTDFQTFSPRQPEMPASWVSQLEQQAPVSQNEPSWYQQDTSESWSNEVREEEEMRTQPPAWLDTLTRHEQPQALAENAAHVSPAPVVPQPEVSPVPEQKTQPPVQSEEEPMPFFFSSEEENEGEMGWPEWLKSLGAEELEPEQAAPPSASLPVANQPAAEAPAWEAPQPGQPAPADDPWAALPSISAHNDAQADAYSQPDWMQQSAPAEMSAAQSATPDWMQQFSPAGTSTQSAAPDWMQQITPIEIPSAQSAAPDWMQQISHDGTPAAQSSAPEWMQQISSLENSAPAQSSIPDWMQQVSHDPVAPAQSSVPEWMQQFSSIEENSPAQSPAPEWMQQFAEAQSPDQSTIPAWMQQISDEENQPYQESVVPASTPVNEQEQRYLTSLDDLERDLQSQGFVPMEPGSLASIAQAQTSVPVQQPQEIQPSLSSALAQLGNFGQQPPTQTNNEPWWNTAQNQEQPTAPGIPHTPNESLNPFAALGARANEEAPRPFAPLPATPMPIAPPPNAGQPLTPTYRSDSLLDSDLETTMKRPAITLQPMKPGEAQGTRSTGNGKGRGSEHKSGEHVDESNLSNHERLIRGYQYQLSGAYEESMQEYRLVIRNAPELLEDVISNLRALLKINPRFSLGYRVLGDAYMRKGEYLQAMESYNKALTMAKKAKN